jgi:hypothetical protein
VSVYDAPEQFGLAVVGEVHDPDACYSVNDFVAWRHEDGRPFWASDSGCSCPVPFEAFGDLASLSTGTADELIADLLAWVESVSEYSSGSVREEATADAHGLIRKVKP